MKRLFFCALLLAALFVLRGSGAAAAPPSGLRAREKVLLGPFGTVSRLTVWDDFSQPAANERFETLWAEIRDLLWELDGLFSLSDPDSEIARFNTLPEGGSLPVSRHTARLIGQCHILYEKTGGYFDPSVFPLVDLWGFSPRFRNAEKTAMPYDRARDEKTGALPPPEARYLEAFLRLAGFSGIRLQEDREGNTVLVKDTKSVTVDGTVYAAQIDLGGIAKGYAADLVTEKMRAAGIVYGFFSCGTSSVSLLASGGTDDGEFRLAVRNPRPAEGTPEAFATVLVSGACLSTSGDYDDNYFVAGQRACHIIDPFTGCPLNMRPDGAEGGLCSATLLSGSACEDDALTTALLLLGEDRARALLKTVGDRDALLVRERPDADGYDVLTSLPEERVLLQDSRFRIVPFE